ncbi:nitrate/sulfonate/bicarbonate ABC transporter ATP-binding protein [Streptomyces kronopolitis]|uniref:ABC transporter ATP-binding protein n=1 Tax=Streptomyces kronopolitis TaxID=1612435 RepID=UPI003687383A
MTTENLTQTSDSTGGATPIITVRNLHKEFPGHNGDSLTVLQNINLELHEGEVVAVIGKPGSGKSTLLRHIAGLLAPSRGTVHYRGNPVTGPNPGTAMLFQSFALLPWLTVQQNVELSLEARGVPQAERRGRALEAIDMVGLDGFENAFPKELSGGMRKRVGLARALVVEPDVLLMDEPFSALDVLTAQTLRTELMELLNRPGIPTAALLVTHNIDEAVQFADRILILDNNPGRIKTELVVAMTHPRQKGSARYVSLVESAYLSLIGEEPQAPSPEETDSLHIGAMLPSASIDSVTGLLELLAARDGAVEIKALGEGLVYEVDDLMPLLEAAQLLSYVAVQGNNLYLTPAGRRFARADILRRKDLFAAAAMSHVPLIRTIRTLLLASDGGRLAESELTRRLCGMFTEQDARRQFSTAIAWGRYAELFQYEAEDHVVLLPDDEASRSV